MTSLSTRDWSNRIEIKIRSVQYCFTINLIKPGLCTAVLSGREWLNVVMKGAFALCYTARVRKQGGKQFKTRQRAVTI